MFFFGIFSTAVPLLVLLAIYVLGFFSGAFLKEDRMVDRSATEKKEINYEASIDHQWNNTCHFSELQNTVMVYVVREPIIEKIYGCQPLQFTSGNEFFYNQLSNKTLFSRPPPAA